MSHRSTARGLKKRSRTDTAEDSSEEEEDEGAEPALDPTADVTATATPSEAGPSHTYGGGAPPTIEGVMQLMERILKGQEEDRVTAQERYNAIMAQQIAMGARIDDLQGEVRSTMSSVRAHFARTDDQLERIYSRMSGGDDGDDRDSDEGDDDEEDDE